MEYCRILYITISFLSSPLILVFQMDIQQVMLYCDPSLAIQEACCEIPGARVRSTTLHYCLTMNLYRLHVEFSSPAVLVQFSFIKVIHQNEIMKCVFKSIILP